MREDAARADIIRMLESLRGSLPQAVELAGRAGSWAVRNYTSGWRQACNEAIRRVKRGAAS